MVGFWSYVHLDDKADDGRITRLAKRIRNEYALITGEDIEVFIDREQIRWGEEWRRRIDEELGNTAFFIPVVTPRYFQSEDCRRELLTFAGHAESLGVKELLLPLLYISIEGLDPQDEVVALVKQTQYENWTELRFVDEDSSTHRRAVHLLALRLAEINERIANETAHSHAVLSAPEGDEEEEPLGILDILAAGEDAIPELAGSLVSIGETVGQISQMTTAATQEIHKSDAAGRGAAGRLLVVKEFADALEEPSERILKVATDYATQLITVDAGVLTLIRSIESSVLEDDERMAVCDFFETIRQLSKQTREATDQLRAYTATLETTGAMSRAMRRPFRRLRDGLKRVIDGQTVIEEWARHIDGVGFDCSEAT